MKFHDGSPFNGDAVVWNAEKVLKQDAAHFDASQVGVTASRMPTLRTARKVDDLTVELTTRQPDSFLPINLTNLFMASPTHWQKLFDAAQGADAKAKVAAAWTAFAANASGTGPFKMERFVARERLELVRNAEYWDKARVPKLDRVVLVPMPEANTRTAALLSGQVDWIEAPAPDSVAQLKQRGMVITANAQPHVWPWQYSFAEGVALPRQARAPGLAKLHVRSVEEAVFLWVAHDVGPPAMVPRVKGYVQPKSWFIDLTTVSMQ